MEFKDRLKFYREKAGFSSAKDFASKLGLPYSTYVAYENTSREPKYSLLVKISELLGVSTDNLLGVHTDNSLWIRETLENNGFNVEFMPPGTKEYSELYSHGYGNNQKCMIPLNPVFKITNEENDRRNEEVFYLSLDHLEAYIGEFKDKDRGNIHKTLLEIFRDDLYRKIRPIMLSIKEDEKYKELKNIFLEVNPSFFARFEDEF